MWIDSFPGPVFHEGFFHLVMLLSSTVTSMVAKEMEERIEESHEMFLRGSCRSGLRR